MTTGWVSGLKFRFRRPLFVSILLLLTIGVAQATAVERTYVGGEIGSPLKLGSALIVGSDSLLLNDQLLARGRDYTLRATVGEVSIMRPVSPGDTLVVYFIPLPAWLQQSFGRPIPEATQAGGQSRRPLLRSTGSSPLPGSDISISGAKSFKVSSRSAGTADFSQTLDLKISGELSEGLFITGHVTDRDVDPTYGSLNSRLSELDRMSIRVHSSSFEAELGDLSTGRRNGLSRAQRMTGLRFNLTQLHLNANATIARPKGEFRSIQLDGLDGLQGPYRLNGSGQSTPVVPGSETVWLDGRLMERGTDKDYQIDYALGRLTFSVDHPIDSRSRIEVDFEPLNFAYKKALYAAGLTAFSNDSTAFFGIELLREGDDSEQPLSGELTDVEKSLLAQAGDSAVWIESVIADSTGNYLLIVDSLPDSVYRWVESGGAFSISFGFVGPGKGDYLSVGNGVYGYAGAGLGDYLPVRLLTAPERTSYYRLTGGLDNPVSGRFKVDWRISSHDRNQLSAFDDQNNRAGLLTLSNQKNWTNNGRAESLRLSYRFREPEYNSRKRIYEADFGRRFNLPRVFERSSDEQLSESELSLQPLAGVDLKVSYANLSYKDRFRSDRGSLRLTTLWHERLTSVISWEEGKSTLDGTATDREGRQSLWRAGLAYRLGSVWQLKSSVERDRRDHNYQTGKQGTRFTRYEFEVGQANESIRYEHYVEDSLVTDWDRQLARDRLSLRSNRKLSHLSYNLTLTQQWSKGVINSDRDFLGRLNFRYDDQAQRLTSSATYLISNEVKNARGITYFEVTPGTGDFIFDEGAPGGGQYLPDDQGDFIRLEEVLSQTSEIRRGERSFLFSKGWSGWRFRFDSRHIEELLESGARSIWWAVPFLVDETESYLYFSGRHSFDFRGIERSGFFLFNLSGLRQVESRLIGNSSPKKETLKVELALKQKSGTVYFEESLKLFRTDRDTYYSGIGLVDGFEAGVGLTRQFGAGEAVLRAGQRVAKSDNNEEVTTYLAMISTRQALFKRGKIRGQFELYRHRFTNVSDEASYQLTDNRPGLKGVRWSLSLGYSLKKDLRSNLSLSGRHSDDRSGRVLARGELIATF